MSSATTSSSLHPLVTQTLVDTKRFFCPFLGRGYCREAARCNFSHDNFRSIKIPNDYCHFYLANQCLYGQDCKFRHTEPMSSNQNLQSHDQENCDAHVYNEDETCGELADEEIHYYTPDSADEINQISEPCVSQQSPEEVLSRFSSSLPLLPTEAPCASKDVTSNKITCSLNSYAKICQGRSTSSNDSSNNHPKKEAVLCPYSCTSGSCPFPIGHCSYLHGLDCDLCGRACLHPFDLDQQRQHRDDCLREHEREMELSFAVQRSKDKVCGICMDTVVEKKPITSSRFGILEKCNHIFCLDCIRKWRGTKQFETRTIRACPECRVSSDFVVPSKYWVEDQDDKDKLIHDYKAALKAKPCKYFAEGKGECPFAGSCFYKHAYPDGRIAKLENPKPRRRIYGARGPTFANYILWNILTSTEDDEWSNDDVESLFLDPDFGTTDDEGFDYTLESSYYL